MYGRRILVIDDDPLLLKMVDDILSAEGAEVYTTSDGRVGLQQFYACQPHLVLLDTTMPGLEGWGTCQLFCSISDVPIILLTSGDETNHVFRGLDCGAIEHVHKPFTPAVLVAQARAALRRTP
jgi:DNA-binding response OmpR family regulator